MLAVFGVRSRIAQADLGNPSYSIKFASNEPNGIAGGNSEVNQLAAQWQAALVTGPIWRVPAAQFRCRW